MVTKHRRSLSPSDLHGKELPLCSALASNLPIPIGPPHLSWEVWCHHHLPGTGKLSFSCLKHQVNTPRDGELSPAEGTGSVLFLVITRLPRPPLEVGNPTQGSRKAAGPELSPSLGAGHPCTPCQPERCHLAVDLGGYSHNRNNALQQS